MSERAVRLHSRRFLIEWLFLGAALLALGGFIAYSLFQEHDRIAGEQRDRLASQAKVVDENIGRQLEGAYQALSGVMEDREYWGSKSGRQNVSRHLKTLSDAMPGVRTIVITDAKGTAIASDREQLIGQNFEQREYFQAPLRNPNRYTLYVGPPFKSMLGVYSISVARMIPGPQGQFAGVVSATLDPEYFTTLLDSVRYAPDMLASLIHGDGRVFLRVPDKEGIAGMDLAKPGSFFTEHMKSGQRTSVFTGIVYSTGEERMTIMRSIQPVALFMDKPMVFAVSRELQAPFAAWRRDVYVQGGLFGILALATTLGQFFYHRRQRAYDRLAASHEAERKRAEQELRIAATAFETQEGILITDAKGVILRVNHAFTELTGYSAGEAVGQTAAMLSSGRHKEEFYRQLWEVLNQDKYWEGEIWNRRKSGEIYPELLTVSAVSAPDGSVTHYVGIFSDITERKAAEEQIRSLAFYDPLTQLPNRRLLHDRFGQALLASARRKNYGAVLFLDLDRFKMINDTRGHEVGDLLLIEAAHRLLSSVRGEDTVARLGGDEFVVVLEDLSQEKQVAEIQAREVAEKIRQTLNDPYSLKDQIHQSSASIGICLFTGSEETVSELLLRADKAMYEAKAAGRNALRVSA